MHKTHVRSTFIFVESASYMYMYMYVGTEVFEENVFISDRDVFFA